MAYEGYRTSQPYEPPLFPRPNSNTNSNSSYANQPPPLHSPVFQPPYPEHDLPLDPNNRLLSQPPLNHSSPAPQPPPPPPQAQTGYAGGPPPPGPPSGFPEPFSDPSRFYQANNAPIADAAASAFRRNDPSTYLPPEILSQITDSVIQRLGGTNLENNNNNNSFSPRPPPPPANTNQAPRNEPPGTVPPPFPPSVSTQSDYSHSPPTTGNKIYTPPSPYRQPEEQTTFAAPQPTQSHQTQHIRSYSHTEAERPPLSPFNAQSYQRSRPSRLSTSHEETTVEKIWGQLFDNDGKPTPRLGQLLRGIAVHLIEDHPPGNTIVITPEKMQKYYQDTKVSMDSYPWKDIFDDRTSSISRLYRDIQAEHHLVQVRLDERPDIPGLTPRGFERWATLMIQAHPEQEYERLQRTVLEMPINNPDDKKERFPKELPRRLFPKFSDQTVKEQLEHAIHTHCHVSIPKPGEHDRDRSEATMHRRHASASIPPPDHRRHASVEDADDDDEPGPIPPIERERQPYSAQPGGGRTYEEPGKGHTDSVKFRDPSEPPRSPSGMGKYRRNESDGYNHPSRQEDTRYREEERDQERDRDDDRFYGRGRERYSEHIPPPPNWSEEEYYRGSGLLGGNHGRFSPPYDQGPPSWSRGY